MRVGKTKKANVNYLAKIVQIDKFIPHPDPEVNKLKCCTVDGFNIICSIDSQPGLYVYFPTSCCLNPNLLSFANLYKHSNMNANPNESGMFEDNGRVKAIKLRKCISEGFILPVVILENFAMSVANKELQYSVNDEFDCIQDGDKEFWVNKKYISKQTQGTPGRIREGKQPKGLDKLVEDQFRFHYDTVIIKKCPNVIHPDDFIHLSSKVHGTSGISSYVLCNPDVNKWQIALTWITNNILRLIAKLFGSTVSASIDPIYDYLYSSRSVIKNRYYNKNVGTGFYGCDVWKYADDVVRPHLDKGMTAYYEILGFLPNGGYIQKSYDYGYEQPKSESEYTYGKHFGIRIYRVTLTNVDGKVHEFSPREVQIWATNKGLIPVTEFYYGKAKDLYPDIPKENWNENFLNRLSNDSAFYMEMDSPECSNPVPHEGMVIKIDNMRSEAFKLKCFKFLNKEQKELDSGVENIEDNS